MKIKWLGTDMAYISKYQTPIPLAWTSRSAENLTLAVEQRVLISTGMAMAIAPHHEIQVRPRSGLAYKHGVTVSTLPAPSMPTTAVN